MIVAAGSAAVAGGLVAGARGSTAIEARFVVAVAGSAREVARLVGYADPSAEVAAGLPEVAAGLVAEAAVAVGMGDGLTLGLALTKSGASRARHNRRQVGRMVDAQGGWDICRSVPAVRLWLSVVNLQVPGSCVGWGGWRPAVNLRLPVGFWCLIMRLYRAVGRYLFAKLRGFRRLEQVVGQYSKKNPPPGACLAPVGTETRRDRSFLGKSGSLGWRLGQGQA